MGGARGFNHGLVLGRILVGLEQNLVELLAHRWRALALAEFVNPLRGLLRNLFFLFNRGQRLGNDVGRRLAKAPFAGTAEIMRRLKQTHQHAGLLLQRRLVTEILARQFGKTEFILGRKLPGQFELDALTDRVGLAEHLRRCRLFKLQKKIGGLDLDPLAAVEFNLG